MTNIVVLPRPSTVNMIIHMTQGNNVDLWEERKFNAR